MSANDWFDGIDSPSYELGHMHGLAGYEEYVSKQVATQRIVELQQAKLSELERRIEKIEVDMFAHHAILMNHSDSIEHIERKLNHKGGDDGRRD